MNYPKKAKSERLPEEYLRLNTEMFSRKNIVMKPIIYLWKFTLPKKSSYGNITVNNLVRTFFPFTQAQQVPLLIKEREKPEKGKHVKSA